MQCSQCFQGNCQRHPRQDHGDHTKMFSRQAPAFPGEGIIANAPSSASSVNQLIKRKLEKLQEENRGTEERDNEIYRLELEEQRRALEKSKKKRKHDNEKEEQLIKSGLNPSVVANMIRNDTSPSNSTSSSLLSSSSGAEHENKKRKEKDSKKSKKDKDGKDKKEKKKKHHKKSKIKNKLKN